MATAAEPNDFTKVPAPYDIDSFNVIAESLLAFELGLQLKIDTTEKAAMAMTDTKLITILGDKMPDFEGTPCYFLLTSRQSSTQKIFIILPECENITENELR